VSKGLTQDLIHTFPYVKKKVVTVYNGVDIKQVIKKENRLLSEVYDDNQIIINVARLVDKKGHQYLIESFKEVNKALPTSKLYLIGRGALFKHLQKIIKDNDLSSDVKLLKQANPYKHLPTATLFVFSSLYEGFGNAIIEAMVCGLPVIATDCLYGPKEILNGGKAVCPHKPVKKITYCKYGILVPPFDSNSENNIGKEKLLAKAILTLLINNKLRDHYKKMSWVRAQDFSLEKMGEGYFYVIKELFR
jgi:glycosyltransferase involved in cell wall biosynthesis